MTYFKPLIGMIWRGIESYGIDPKLVIKDSVYKPGVDSGNRDRIPYSEIESLVMDALRLIDDPAFGLRVGENLLPSHLGAFGYAWMASSTLRDALERMQRFGRIYHEQLKTKTSEDHGVFKVEQRLRHVSPIADIAADSQHSAILTLCRNSFGNSLMPVFVQLRRSTPPDPSIWHHFFGVEVQFGQSVNCMGLKLEDVNKQLTGASRKMVLMHEDIIRRQLANLDRSEILNRAVTTIIEQLPSGNVSEISVAKALNISKRTLHRKLSEKDISFRSLLTNLRKDLVSQYIEEPTYSMTEISFLLGYADTSAFSHAYKRWYGVSPMQARELK